MFECRYKADDSVIKEFVTKVLAHKIIAQAIFMVVVSLVVTALSMRSSRSFFTYLYMGVAALSILSVAYFPAKTMKKFKASDSAFFNGKADETVITFTEDEIIVTEEPSSMHIAYDQVERILTYKVICVLLTSKTNGIVVKKDSFGDKSFEEFLEFINEKCVNKNKAAERERQEALEKKRNKHKKHAPAAKKEPAEEIKEEAAKEEETKEAEENIPEVTAEVAGIDESEVAEVVDAEVTEEEKK